MLGLAVVAAAATAYAAFPAHPGDAMPRVHRHADGVVHAHDAAPATAYAAPERDAAVRHGGVHAHGGRVHVHAEASHSRLTIPEVGAVASPDGVPASGSVPTPPPERSAPTGADGAGVWTSTAHPVETPPPIGRG